MSFEDGSYTGGMLPADNHHTPEGADTRQILQHMVFGTGYQLSKQELDNVMTLVAAEVHASNRRLLTSLLDKTIGKAVGVPVVPVSAIDAELEKLGRGEA